MNEPENPTYILIPGAGGMAWYWHRVVALLEQAQREAIAVDLPGNDESAGLSVYVDIVVREIGQRTNIILVAQSLGGFTAAIVCQRVPVRRLVFINAMIPLQGETAGDWWQNTGATRARIAAAESAGYGRLGVAGEFDSGEGRYGALMGPAFSETNAMPSHVSYASP
jgi:pimeloyl-ACP methyl ester carboxylesterase